MTAKEITELLERAEKDALYFYTNEGEAILPVAYKLIKATYPGPNLHLLNLNTKEVRKIGRENFDVLDTIPYIQPAQDYLNARYRLIDNKGSASYYDKIDLFKIIRNYPDEFTKESLEEAADVFYRLGAVAEGMFIKTYVDKDLDEYSIGEIKRSLIMGYHPEAITIRDGEYTMEFEQDRENINITITTQDGNGVAISGPIEKNDIVFMSAVNFDRLVNSIIYYNMHKIHEDEEIDR